MFFNSRFKVISRTIEISIRKDKKLPLWGSYAFLRRQSMEFYEVICRCGHVGNGNYVLKSFAVFARNRKDAARRARSIPRVKHHNKHAIEDVIEVDEYRFLEIQYLNDMDPYFHCNNKREQKATCDLEVLRDDRLVNIELRRTGDAISRKAVYSGKTKIKNPHKFYKYHEDDMAA